MTLASPQGIQPVAPVARTLGFRDFVVLWGDLGIGLLVLFTGSLLVPGLGLATACAAIVLGSIIGVALLALAGVPSSVSGVPGMVVFRGVLGVRGSYVPTVINVVQLLGWTIFELVIMGYAANAVSKRWLGWDAYGLWVALAAALVLALGLAGPLSVVRRFLGRFAVWVMLATSVYLTVVIVTGYDLAALWARPGKGGWPSFWNAVDLVIAMPISWMPLVGDYNRLARRVVPAAWGTALGYLIANVWFYALGALILLAANVAQEPRGFVEAVMVLIGPVALLVLLVDETDEAWADLYSCAVSIQNIVPGASQSVLLGAVAAVSFLAALAVDLTAYEHFLLLIGSVFVPLFGVLMADFFVLGRRYHAPDLFGARRASLRGAGFVAWGAGAAVYHWLTGNLAAVGLPGLPWAGASIPSLLTALIAHVILAGWVAPAARRGRF